MSRFCGLDIHKKEVQAVVIDELGKVVWRERFAATRDGIQAFTRRQLTAETQVALEATTNTWPIAALLQPHVAQVVVSNPLRTKAIAQAKIKTDKVDSLVLAQLLRADFLPSVWIPPEPTRELRRHTTEQAMLTSDRTRIKNRIHAILHQRLIEAPAGDLFASDNVQWLRSPIAGLDEPGRAALDRQLRLLEGTQKEIETVTADSARRAYQDPNLQLLMTLPGLDFSAAEALLAALGDPQRFPTPDQAAAYLGLVPSTYQSGDRCYHGHITKQGRSHARWMMVQAAQSVALHSGPLGVFFRRIARKKGRNVAVVAAARKLVTIAWHMLKNNEPYRYAQPKTVSDKFARLRLLATGEKRKSGPPKGSPRSASYGSGNRTRAVPSLAEVYHREGLPALRQVPPPGETKMLAAAGPEVSRHLAEIKTAKRMPRHSPPKA